MMTDGGRVDPREAGDAELRDPRIRAILEVLGGDPVETVAERWAVDAALVHRWVDAFVEAGTAQVTNRPSGEIARERDRFLSTFMYGLRSPLAVAQMWVAMLQDVRHDPVSAGEMMAHLSDSLESLAERAVDVELLTAAMLGRLSLDARRITVAEALLRAADAGTARYDGSRVGSLADAVREVAGDVACTVEVDPDLFGRVLRDLWLAAHSTGERSGEVRLDVEAVHPWVEIRVVRVGAPLDPQVLHAMFEPFEERDDSTRVTVGLYLARALTVVHGGTLGAEQDDAQTTFWVRVPERRPTMAAVPDLARADLD